MLDPKKTALLLVGLQNEWFHPEGALKGLIEGQAANRGTLENTLNAARAAAKTETLVVLSPTVFQPGYPELVEPVGVLASIKDAGAFQAGMVGSAYVDEAMAMIEDAQRSLQLPGKHGLNSFNGTQLEKDLRAAGITDIVLAGVVTSLCVDTNARTAYELGFRVHVLEDCIAGRTEIEDKIYCEEIFPMYANVLSSAEFMEAIGAHAATA